VFAQGCRLGRGAVGCLAPLSPREAGAPRPVRRAPEEESLIERNKRTLRLLVCRDHLLQQPLLRRGGALPAPALAAQQLVDLGLRVLVQLQRGSHVALGAGRGRLEHAHRGRKAPAVGRLLWGACAGQVTWGEGLGVGAAPTRRSTSRGTEVVWYLCRRRSVRSVHRARTPPQPPPAARCAPRRTWVSSSSDQASSTAVYAPAATASASSGPTPASDSASYSESTSKVTSSCGRGSGGASEGRF
jgi:hypothetical protein